MTGCTEPGSKIYYSRSDNQKRKYPHTLEFVETVNGLVSVNTGRANSLVKDALLGGRIAEVGPLTPNQVKPEAAIPGGAGRFDFQLSQGDDITFIEVKSVTLHLEDGLGRFQMYVTSSTATSPNCKPRCKRVREVFCCFVYNI